VIICNNNYSNQHIMSILFWCKLYSMVTALMPCSVCASVMIHAAVKQLGAGVLAGWSAAVPALVAGRLNAGVTRCSMLQLVAVPR
jgi:tRNA(Arg) A34 adenosine deaminase TadA